MPNILLPGGETSSEGMDPTMLIGIWADHFEELYKSQGDSVDKVLVMSPPASLTTSTSKSPFKKGRSSPAIRATNNLSNTNKQGFDLSATVDFGDSHAEDRKNSASPIDTDYATNLLTELHHQTNAPSRLNKIIRAHMGMPTFPLSLKFIAAVQAALQKTDKDKQAIDYSHPQGPLLAREIMANALNRWYSEKFAKNNEPQDLRTTFTFADQDDDSSSRSSRKVNGPFNSEDVIFTTGGANALNNIFKVLREENPNGVILTPFPYYTLYRGEDRKNNLFPIHMLSENNYHLTAQALEAAITAAKHAGHTISAITICDPANPLGTIIGREEWIKLAGVIRKYNLRVILDEAYAEMCLNGEQHVSLLHVAPELKKNIVLLRSATKGFSAAGWRMAITAIWDEKLRAKFVSSNIQSTGHAASNNAFLYANLMSEVTSEDLKEIANYYRPKVEYVSDRLKKMGLWIDSNYSVAGTFYVCACIKELFGLPLPEEMKRSLGITSKVISTDLEAAYYLMFQDNFTVNALSNFGVDPRKGWIRITCSGTEAQLQEFMNRLQARLDYARKEKIERLIISVSKNLLSIEQVLLGEQQDATTLYNNFNELSRDQSIEATPLQKFSNISQRFKNRIGINTGEPTLFDFDEDAFGCKNEFKEVKVELNACLTKLISALQILRKHYSEYPAKRKLLWNLVSWPGQTEQKKKELKKNFIELLDYRDSDSHLNVLLNNFIEVVFSNKRNLLASQSVVVFYRTFLEKLESLVSLFSSVNVHDPRFFPLEKQLFNEINSLDIRYEIVVDRKKILQLEEMMNELAHLQVSLNPNAARIIGKHVLAYLGRKRLKDFLAEAKEVLPNKWREWIGNQTAEVVINNPVLRSVPYKDLETLSVIKRVECKDWMLYLRQNFAFFEMKSMAFADKLPDKEVKEQSDKPPQDIHTVSDFLGSPRKADGSEKKIHDESISRNVEVPVTNFFAKQQELNGLIQNTEGKDSAIDTVNNYIEIKLPTKEA